MRGAPASRRSKRSTSSLGSQSSVRQTADFASDHGEERQRLGNGRIILETSQAILSFIQSLFASMERFIPVIDDGEARSLILAGAAPDLLDICPI
jgi:hypothetical protein